MTSNRDEARNLQYKSAPEPVNKQRAVFKAALIGMVCGVFFILAAKMVSIALA
ncbi:hypothetical protein LJ739_13280 [Aestuariibacter halophilus]|uniref:Uncharacterized protein n=1 Tax=Fluctibacter halophilus TaxID=226011 RepID=A0ABS8GBN8_9ALTE|nr:hypothetical protein [Aestuariibacter halophilus]MCC2617220.1 hypothetical protein [Aestuariibacter halophilus]